MVFYGLLMVLYDLVLHFRVLCGILMFMSGLLMVFHGFIPPFLAVIDPNSFCLVKVDFWADESVSTGIYVK